VVEGRGAWEVGGTVAPLGRAQAQALDLHWDTSIATTLAAAASVWCACQALARGAQDPRAQADEHQGFHDTIQHQQQDEEEEEAQQEQEGEEGEEEEGPWVGVVLCVRVCAMHVWVDDTHTPHTVRLINQSHMSLLYHR
jgi:hypothetical protein